MRVPVVAILLLSAVLAGCSSPVEKPEDPTEVADVHVQEPDLKGGDGTAGGSNPPSAQGSLVLSDCMNVGGVFPVPMEAASAQLPQGFEPVVSPNDPAGGATLYMIFLQCGGSSVDGQDTGGVTLAYAELAVTPPDEHRLPGVSDYTVPLVMGVGAEQARERLASFGLGLVGPATVTDVLESGPGPQRLRMVVDDVAIDLAAQLSPQEATPLAEGDFALIGVQDGTVRSVVRGHASAGSAVQGGVTQQSAGLPLFAQARPTAVGFSVAGFTLTFALASVPGAA